jgi:hypothetical protein
MRDALRERRIVRMIIFSTSTIRKKMKPRIDIRGQSDSGSAAVSNNLCGNGV